MNKEEKILLEKVYSLLKSEKINDAKILIENTLLNERYKNFLKYMNQRKAYSSLWTKYGMIDNKQIFTDSTSFYIMDNPFYIDMNNLSKEQINLDFLKELKDKFEKEEYKSSPASFSKIFKSDQEVVVISDENEERFYGKKIKEAIGILGKDLEYLLFDEKPVLCAKNENGKAYILGLNNK